MSLKSLLSILFISILFPVSVWAQEDKSLTTDSIPDLMLFEDSTAQKEVKKKKPKKNLFYGMKCRKGFTREGYGPKETAELFYCLKKPIEPSAYLDEIYVWDLSKGKVVKLKQEDLKKLTTPYKILHGPYAKYVDRKLVESGIFYVGAKHGRWEKYSKDNILIGKAKYWRGWQREAKISYYDSERKKVKEVVPQEYGARTGPYYLFSESGQLLTKGNYADGKKIGMWVDYFKDKTKKQRETQYPKDQYDAAEPVVVREWDDKGNLIVNNGEKIDPKDKANDDPIKKSFKKKKTK
jgi:antitoxin component YwqK of YwqJK toxin-antitoxin module